MCKIIYKYTNIKYLQILKKCQGYRESREIGNIDLESTKI